MIHMGMISEGLASLNAAKNIAEGLITLRDTAKFQAAVFDLQGKILSAQSDHFALLEHVRELETKMAKLEAWEAEKKRYALTEVSPSHFAYVLKTQAGEPEPPHRICASCFQKGDKSILQYAFTSSGKKHYACHTCKAQVVAP
jgi:hypothetical protein